MKRTQNKPQKAIKVMFSPLFSSYYAATALRCDDVCTKGNHTQAWAQPEQCECRAAGDSRGGADMLCHHMEQLGRV